MSNNPIIASIIDISSGSIPITLGLHSRVTISGWVQTDPTPEADIISIYSTPPDSTRDTDRYDVVVSRIEIISATSDDLIDRAQCLRHGPRRTTSAPDNAHCECRVVTMWG